jgi:hypothetical protein
MEVLSRPDLVLISHLNRPHRVFLLRRMAVLRRRCHAPAFHDFLVPVGEGWSCDEGRLLASARLVEAPPVEALPAWERLPAQLLVAWIMGWGCRLLVAWTIHVVSGRGAAPWSFRIVDRVLIRFVVSAWNSYQCLECCRTMQFALL